MDTDKKAGAIQAMETAEARHRHAHEWRAQVERKTALGAPGTSEQFYEAAKNLRWRRRRLAQSIFDTYGAGVSASGGLLWKEDE